MLVVGIAEGVALLVLAIFALNRVRAGGRPLEASFFLWLELIYVAILITTVIVYNDPEYGFQQKIPPLVAGLVPIGVPWFGAMGAVIVGLEGVFKHSGDWDARYNNWHVARPLFGAVLAIIAYFLFVLIMNAANSPPPFLLDGAERDAQTSGPLDFVAYFVVGFLVGYREETFRELVKRATDLILQPGGPYADNRARVTFEVNGSRVSSVDLGDVEVGDTKEQVVEVGNVGKEPIRAPALVLRQKDATGDHFSLTDDPFAASEDLEPGGRVEVTIAVSPASPGPLRASLILTGGGLEKPARLILVSRGVVRTNNS